MKRDTNLGLKFPLKTNTALLGKKSQRALTDLSIFGEGGQKINIEFKEGPTRQTEVDGNIEKLIREPNPSVLIHFLPTRENDFNPEHPKILMRLIIKLNNSLSKFKAKDNFWILFVIMVRDHNELWYLTKQKENLRGISLEEFKRISL